jgi:hypothetical protein
MAGNPDRRLKAVIFLSVLGAYYLTSSREPPWGDARGMWDVADHLVREGRLDISFPWPVDIPRGRNGLFYGITPVLTALVHLPGVLLARLYVQLNGAVDAAAFIGPLACHLAPALLGALTCLFFFGICRRVGARSSDASLATGFLAFASTLFVYARYPYSEIVQIAFFTGFVYQVVCVLKEPSARRGLWLGVWSGLLINAKYIYALSVLGGVCLLVWTLRHQWTQLLRILAFAALGGAPFVVLAAAYNYLRWGSVFESGYGPYVNAFFGGSAFTGMWGMLLSPNKSVFLYTPALVLAAVGMVSAYRLQKSYLAVLAFTALPVVLVCATYRSWSGDYAWGPRLLVFAVPALMVPLVFVFETLRQRRARLRVVLLATFFSAGLAIQLLGSSLYWDHFVRISLQARTQWLGNPNRSGAHVAERGRGHCDSCFEDMYPIQWLPPFQPIRGHWWLIKSLWTKADWKQAEATAPWHEFTTLKLNIADSYARVRFDWWGLLWLRDFPAHRMSGLWLLTIFLGLTIGAGAWWFRLHRREPEEKVFTKVQVHGPEPAGAGHAPLPPS